MSAKIGTVRMERNNAIRGQKDMRRTNQELKKILAKVIEQRDNLLKFAMNAPVESGVCCCGDDMNNHNGDHSAVDQFGYSLSCFEREFRKFDNENLAKC